MITLRLRALTGAPPTLVAFAAAVLAFGLGAAGAAAKTQTQSVHLRVEGPDGPLEPGRGHVAGTVRTRQAVGPNPNCVNRGGRPRFPGITALGAVGLAARHNVDLAPLRMRLTDFGWQLCAIGSDRGFGTEAGDFGGWLYRVNNQAGSSAIDEAQVRLGDEVLLHYAVFPGPESTTEPLNNGRELVLRGVPARVRPGDEVEVRAVGFGFAPDPEPATGGEGIEVRGAGEPVPTDGNGFASVTVDDPGTTRLVAVDTTSEPDGFGSSQIDIPSERLAVCARAKLTDCAPHRGTRFFGSPRADRIRGTRGDDVIRAGPGSDVIDLRPGGRNRVLCAGGNDRVIFRRGDRAGNVLRGCERVVLR